MSNNNNKQNTETTKNDAKQNKETSKKSDK